MKLKAKIDKAGYDALPEATRALYALVEGSDGVYMLEVDGIEDHSGVQGLREALNKERKNAADLRKEADKFKDVDPAKYRDLMQKAADAERQKLTDEGNYKALEQQLKDLHAAELKKATDRTALLMQNLEGALIDSSAVAAIAAAKGVPELLMPHVRSSVKLVEKDGKFGVAVVDKDGNARIKDASGAPMSVADLVGEMRGNEVFGRAFEADNKGGTGGGSGAGKPGAGGKAPGNWGDAKTVDQQASYLEAKYGIGAT